MQHEAKTLPMIVAAMWCSALGSTESMAQDRPPTPVIVDVVKREAVQERRQVTGELRAVKRARVATQEPGMVFEIPVQEGQTVGAGETLAQLDDHRLRIELSQAESDVSAAQATIEEREADLHWRELDLENLRSLSQDSATNPKEMYDAESEARIARVRVVVAERLRQVAETRVEMLRTRISDKTIVAPFDGVVVSKLVEKGEWLAEGDAVLELVSTGAIEAWLDVPQRFAHAIFGKQPTITINIEATNEMIESAELRIVPLVDPAARTFSLVARLNNESGALAPGMSLTAWVPTGAMSEQLTVPKDAVMRNATGSFVYAARTTKPDGPASAMMVEIEPLFAVGPRMVVRSAGLQPQDQVVVEGNERLFPMMPIASKLVEPGERGERGEQAAPIAADATPGSRREGGGGRDGARGSGG